MEKRSRGRPPLAAQSLDAALAAVYEGRAPKRPRNEFERMASRKRRGRKPNGHAPTRVAAELAAYLVSDGMTLSAAVKQAATAYRADVSNVRRYAKRLITGPVVEVKDRTKGATWVPLVTVRRVPVVAFMVAITDGNFTPN